MAADYNEYLKNINEMKSRSFIQSEMESYFEERIKEIKSIIEEYEIYAGMEKKLQSENILLIKHCNKKRAESELSYIYAVKIVFSRYVKATELEIKNILEP